MIRTGKGPSRRDRAIMKVLVIGANGPLGLEVLNQCQHHPYQFLDDSHDRK